MTPTTIKIKKVKEEIAHNERRIDLRKSHVYILKKELEQLEKEPVVLTAEESIERYGDLFNIKDPCCKYPFNYGFKEGKEKGRLERDLELRPLTDRIIKCSVNFPTFSQIELAQLIEMAQDLPPLIKD